MNLKSALQTLLITVLSSGFCTYAGDAGEYQVELGERPFSLIKGMDDGRLKRQLERCADGPFSSTDFSIGHRGAPVHFPEHTRESYEAAAKMGAGLLECDVTFTKDRALVCRHSQCDLHRTTNILQTPLAAKCSQGFIPYDAEDIDRKTGKPKPARAKCCTSDLTLAEFKTLKGKKDAANTRAKTIEEYVAQDATAHWRSDLSAERGTLLSHAESIELFKKLGTGMTPELKAPAVAMPYEGDYSQQDYAQQMIDEYKAAGVNPHRVWPQSFNLDDVLYWVENEPRFGQQAVYLDSRPYRDESFAPRLTDFDSLRNSGVGIVAPPMFALLDLNQRGQIVASEYARLARLAGLEIIAWTFERTDLRGGAARNPFYYQSIGSAIDKESDKYLALDVLAREVKLLGIFTDWPATVTYYANCFDL